MEGHSKRGLKWSSGGGGGGGGGGSLTLNRPGFLESSTARAADSAPLYV